MKKTQELGFLWYHDPIIDTIINAARREGFVYRRFTSQAQWTDFGVETLCAFRRSNGIVCNCSNCVSKRLYGGEVKKVKPITPKQVVKIVPDEVIEAWNELIQRYWDGYQSIIKQTDAAALIALKTGNQKDTKVIYDKGYLSIEGLYRSAGWEVEYDKPAAKFIFKKKDEVPFQEEVWIRQLDIRQQKSQVALVIALDGPG